MRLPWGGDGAGAGLVGGGLVADVVVGVGFQVINWGR